MATYQIQRQQHYYGPYSTPWLPLDDGKYNSRTAASTEVAERRNGTYFLDHNESSSPSYRVVSSNSRNWRFVSHYYSC